MSKKDQDVEAADKAPKRVFVMKKHVTHGANKMRHVLKQGEICPDEFVSEFEKKGWCEEYKAPVAPVAPVAPAPATPVVAPVSTKKED